MRHGVNWTKTTSAADEILRCRCRAGESLPADCSRAVVQRLRSSDRRVVCWSVERSTCRCRPIGAGDGRRECVRVCKKVVEIGYQIIKSWISCVTTLVTLVVLTFLRCIDYTRKNNTMLLTCPVVWRWGVMRVAGSVVQGEALAWAVLQVCRLQSVSGGSSVCQ